MKKAYVKPVMESEAFVANEYVAACFEYTFTCQGTDIARVCLWGGLDHTKTVKANSESAAVAALNESDSRSHEQIKGSSGSYTHTSDWGATHKISVSNPVVLDKKHPNASV